MYDKPNATSQLLLFAEPPNLSELCVVTAKLSKQIVKQSSAVQPQILKCREIIFTEPSVIATPAYDISNAFHIVMEQSLYKTGRLQARFQKIGLEVSKPTLVSPAMYQACLRYTLVARIAPNWNKTGEWLIQGRDFLTSNGYVNAVKLDITVNQGEMYFSLDATTVKFLPLQVEDLDIYAKCYKEFMENQHAEIDECAIGSPWSHVLPSMKKGKVVGISRALPQNGPFKSYKDLKRHWKNTYGYRLPDSEDGVIYYQVNFRPLGGRIFTYPEVCLRASDIQRVPRVDPKPILTAFLQSIQSKMSSICGSSLHLQSKAKYPILELLPPSLQMPKQAPNLSNRLSSGKIIYRSKEEMEIMLNKTHSATKVTHSHSDPNHDMDSQTQVPTHQEDSDGIFQCRNEWNDLRMPSRPQSRNNLHSDVFSTSAARPAMIMHHNTSRFTTGSSQPTLAPVNSSSQPAPARIVPFFTPKTCPSSKKSNNFASSGSSTSCSQKTVPVFKPKKIGTIGSNASPSTRPDRQNFQQQPPAGVTCFSKENMEQGSVIGSDLSQTAIVPSTTPSFKPKYPSAMSCSKDYFTGKSSLQTTHSQIVMSSSIWISSTKTNSGILKGSSSTPQISVLPVHSTPKLQQMTPKGTPSTVRRKQLKQDEEGTPKPKKPRLKPQIQDNFNVELFARANKLQKANAATLIAWLKDKGIQHKSKDKKSDLIDRVNTVLGLAVEP